MATEPDDAATTADLAQARPAFLRRVQIRGYKSIAFCDVTLEPLTVFVGRNGAGKSNFLDALAFVRDAMAINFPYAVGHRGGWPRLACQSLPDKRIAIELELEVTGGPDQGREGGNGEKPLHFLSPPVAEFKTPLVAVYGFEIAAGHGDLPVLEREFLRFPDGEINTRYGFNVDRRRPPETWKLPTEADEPALRYLIQKNSYRPDGLILSVLGDTPFVNVAGGLRQAAFYNIHPAAIHPLLLPDPGSVLEHDGRNLASVIERVQEADQAAIARVGAYLSAIVPEVEGFEVVRYGKEYRTVQFRLRSRISSQPLLFDAMSMSDGTLRVLACLMAVSQLHLPAGPVVVGIEEPETALHPAAMHALVDALDEATLGTQVLLTTHSADLLDNPTVRPENVRVVEMIDGETFIGPLDGASGGIVREKLDTLGGLERQNQLALNLDDLDRQRRLAPNGQGQTK